MKNKQFSLSVLLVIMLSILSCNESSNKKSETSKNSTSDTMQSTPTLQLSKDIDKKKTDFSLNKIANDKQLLSFETTDKSLIAHIQLEFVTPKYICLKDRHKLFFFDHSGKYQFSLNAKGNGPGEYNFLSDALYDSDNAILFIHDMLKNKILKYDKDLQFIDDIDINSFGEITMLDKNHYAASFSPYANKNHLVGILDKSFETKKEFIHTDLNNEKYTKKGFIMMIPFIPSNNGLYVKPLFSDTVYQVTPQCAKHLFIVDKQNLNPPIEVVSDMSQRKNHSKYISNDYGIIIDELYFTTFNYNDKRYQDIWDIKQSELLYRNIASSAKDKYGVPVNINDELIYVWPVFVENSVVYCKIDPRDQEIFKTNAEENDLMFTFTPEEMN